MRHVWIICLALWLGFALRANAQPNVTSYPQMTAQLKADAARCPLIRLTSVGQSAKGHRDLWLVRIAAPTTASARTIRVLILCRQHGDEPASTEAVLNMVHRLAGGGDPSLRASLSQVTFYIVPMVNPDGAEANTRVNGAGADLNRDWGVFHQPETQAVAHAARFLQPNIVIDAHNWDGDDEYNADCLEIPRETATPQGQASHTLQQQAMEDLAACGYSVHPTAWGADTDPRLAHRWFAHQNILSALVETHSGDPADRTDFQQREGMYVALIHSLARHYSMMPAVEKKRLEAREGDNGGVQDAVLFPPLPASPRAGGALRHHSYGWLWAFGIYGLALWGGRRTAPDASGFPSCFERGKRIRKKRLLPWLLPFPLRGGQPLAAGPVSGYYSGTRKRDGTATKVRSGQRKAVSIPPR